MEDNYPDNSPVEYDKPHTTPIRRVEDFAPASDHWYWETDSEHRFTWMSDNIERLLGLKPALFYGRARTQIMKDSISRENWNQYESLVAAHEPFQNIEYQYQLESGASGWAKISGVPYFSDSGEFLGYRGTGAVVTQYKEVEEAARLATECFQQTADHFCGGLMLYDNEDRLIYVSKQLNNFFPQLEHVLKTGTRRETWLREMAYAGLVAEALGCEEEWLQDSYQSCKPDGETTEVKRGDYWFHSTYITIPGGGYLNTLIDITDRKEAETRIEEERRLLRSLLDNIPEVIYAKNLDSKFIVANKATTDHMLALNPEHTTVIDKDDTDFFDKETAASYKKEEISVLTTGKVYENELGGPVSPGSKQYNWVSTLKAPLRDSAGKIVGLVGYNSNITRKRALNVELNNSRRRFRDFAETAADWFWESDENLRITYLSEKYQEQTGGRPKDMYGRTLEEFAKSLISKPEIFAKLQKSLTAQKNFSNYELTFSQDPNNPRHCAFSGKPFYCDQGHFGGFRGIGKDVTEAKRLQDQLTHRAHHDNLTGLPNRESFDSRLNQELFKIRNSQSTAVVGYLDLDQFKLVNDTVGHRAGDRLLCQVTSLLKTRINGKNMLARLGGDEFGLLLTDISIEEATCFAQEILVQLSDYRFSWKDKLFDVGGSIGLVELNAENHDSSEVLSEADIACYAAKERGRNRCHVFTQCDDELIARQNEMLAATGIRSALEQGDFRLYMQPIAKVGSQPCDFLHYEILLRMQDEEGNIVPPGAFIPAAERYGLMNEIDRWVIAKAIQSFHDVIADEKTGITINLSGGSMTDTALFEYIRKQLESNAVDPARVCFEITETAVVNSIEIAKQFMHDVKQLGCTMALDDFGSGLSSFTYLKHLDVDYLKIDGSFVRELANDKTDQAVVTAINSIGHSMGIKTIAEFVENDEILSVLQKLNVDFAQGYGIGKPVPYEARSLAEQVDRKVLAAA